eukprot:8293744-Heterocapsa_arctica.AAC.1
MSGRAARPRTSGRAGPAPRGPDAVDVERRRGKDAEELAGQLKRCRPKVHDLGLDGKPRR